MNIYLQAKMAYVDLGSGFLLCIGTKEEVDKADGNKIADMVKEAVAMSRWRAIADVNGMTLH